MATWGFVILTPYDEEIFTDFGYETEEDAMEFGKDHMRKYHMSSSAYRLKVEQRWEDF